MASSFDSPGGSTTSQSSSTSSTPAGGSNTSGELRQELRDDAKNLASTARQRVQSEVDARKGGAVSQIQTLSSALGETAQKLGDDTPSWLRSAIEQGAQSLEQFARTVEQKDAQALGRDAQRLARENPGTFLAGCTLAGFLAARVFKDGAGAGSSGSNGTSDHSSYAGSGQSGGQDQTGGSDFTSNRPTYVPEAVS